MNFNDIIAIIKSVILKNYVNFEGRATRAEFWWFFLFTFVIGVICSVLGKVGVILSAIIGLGLLLPNLGLSVRRLHDINKSGWLLLLSFIPLVGAIILIVWWAKEGDAEPNQYGPVPETPKAETLS